MKNLFLVLSIVATAALIFQGGIQGSFGVVHVFGAFYIIACTVVLFDEWVFTKQLQKLSDELTAQQDELCEIIAEKDAMRRQFDESANFEPNFQGTKTGRVKTSIGRYQYQYKKDVDR